MKTKNSVIKYLNLSELATECFFAALDKFNKAHIQANQKLERDTHKYLLDNYLGTAVIIGVADSCDRIDQVMQKLSVEKSIQLGDDLSRFVAIIDKVTITPQKLSRIDQAVQLAEQLGLKAQIYYQSSNRTHNNIWSDIQIPKDFDEQNLNDAQALSGIRELSWDEVHERFLNPTRYSQFQSLVERLFGFGLYDKTILIELLNNLKNHYLSNTQQLNKLFEVCDGLHELASVNINVDINKLPRSLLNILVATKAYLLNQFDDSFEIDGPLPDFLDRKITVNQNKNKRINDASVQMNWDTLSRATDGDQTWIIKIPDSAWCYGPLSVFFGIADELKRFYRSVSKEIYRGSSLQQILEGNVLDFLELFANHPRFRGFSGVWRQMKLPNYKLSQQLEDLSYPEALLVTIAKAASRIREDSVILAPIVFQGISIQQSEQHLLPLIEWCERHRCRVYL